MREEGCVRETGWGISGESCVSEHDSSRPDGTDLDLDLDLVSVLSYKCSSVSLHRRFSEKTDPGFWIQLNLL